MNGNSREAFAIVVLNALSAVPPLPSPSPDNLTPLPSFPLLTYLSLGEGEGEDLDHVEDVGHGRLVIVLPPEVVEEDAGVHEVLRVVGEPGRLQPRAAARVLPGNLELACPFSHMNSLVHPTIGWLVVEIYK